MKKLIFVLALAAIIATGTAFADHPSGLGIGVQGGGGGVWEGGGFGMYRGAALSLKVPSLPIFWAIDVQANIWGIWLGVAGDFYFVDAPLIDKLLHWYLGFGVGVGLGLYDDLWLQAVARVPVGVSFQLPINAGPLNAFEVYLQVVPSLGIRFAPDFYFPAGGWPINLGVRLWF